MKPRYALLSAVILALLFFSPKASIAQNNAVSVFEAAVDQINCETIRFIHREADRPEVANNMECLSFESIMKSIPEDEQNTTGKLAKDINSIKSRYKAGQDIAPQLDAAIAVATKKIESKQRKQNVPDFKAKLATIRNEAIKNAQALAANTPAANKPANEGDNTSSNTITEEGTADTGSHVSLLADEGDADEASGGSNWLGWLSLIISLLALALAGSNFLRRGKEAPTARAYPLPQNTQNYTGGGADDEALEQMEIRLHQEMKRLRDEFDEKIAAVTASTGYTEPEAMYNESEQESEMEMPPYQAGRPEVDEDGIPSLSDASVEAMDLDVTEEERDELEGESHEVSEPEERVSAKTEEYTPDITAEKEEIRQVSTAEAAEIDEPLAMEDNDEKEPEQFEITSEEIAEMPDEPAPAPFRGSGESNVSRPSAAQPAPDSLLAFMDTGEEEEEGLPFYRYLGAPTADGSFSDEDLSDTAAQDSVYEVELYEDVPNKAFFSPLPYPEVVTKLLAEPDKYLMPCCAYSEAPAGKQHIIVVEEGTLRKQDGKWTVHDKAKIRFA